MTQFLNKSFSVAMPGNTDNWPWPDPKKEPEYNESPEENKNDDKDDEAK